MIPSPDSVDHINITELFICMPGGVHFSLMIFKGYKTPLNFMIISGIWIVICDLIFPLLSNSILAIPFSKLASSLIIKQGQHLLAPAAKLIFHIQFSSPSLEIKGFRPFKVRVKL